MNERVERMLRLAFDPGATEGEAVAAFKKAREFALGHGGFKAVATASTPPDPMPCLKESTRWSGKTFDIKDFIMNDLGGKWDAAKKEWIVPPLSRDWRQEIEDDPSLIFGVIITPAYRGR